MRRLILLSALVGFALPASALHSISTKDNDEIQPLIDQARQDVKDIAKEKQKIADRLQRLAANHSLDAPIQSEWESDPEVIKAKAHMAQLAVDRIEKYRTALHLTLTAAGLMATDRKTGKLVPPEATMLEGPFAGRTEKWYPEVGNRPPFHPGDVAETGGDGVTNLQIDALDRMQDIAPPTDPDAQAPIKVTPALMALILYHESRHFQKFSEPGRDDAHYPLKQDKEIWNSTDQANALNILFPNGSPDRKALDTLVTLQKKHYDKALKDEEYPIYQMKLALKMEDAEAAHFAAFHTDAELSELERSFNAAETDIAADKANRQEAQKRRAAQAQVAQNYLTQFTTLAGALCKQGEWGQASLQSYAGACAGHDNRAVSSLLLTEFVKNLPPCEMEVMPILTYCDDADRVQSETQPVLGKFPHSPAVPTPADPGDPLRSVREAAARARAQDSDKLHGLFQDMADILSALCDDPSDAWDQFDAFCRDRAQAQAIENTYASRGESAPKDWWSSMQNSGCGWQLWADAVDDNPMMCFGPSDEAQTANARRFESQAGAFNRKFHPRPAPAPIPAPHQNPKPAPRDPGNNNGGCPPGTHGRPPNCGRAADPL